MLDIIGRRGRSGRVIVRDARDDGSVILLVCEEFDGEGAIIAAPDEKESGSGDDDPGGFPWPGPETKSAWADTIRSALDARHLEPFRLTLDTTGLPAGPVEFNMQQFVAAAVDAADAGVTEVRLDRDNAARWGLRERSPEEVAERRLT